MISTENFIIVYYSQLSLNGHPSIRWAPGVGPCHFLSHLTVNILVIRQTPL